MSEQLLLERFQDWTKGLGENEARIALFERIRDISYYLVPQIEDPYEWATSILQKSKGSCSPKHYLLGFFFAKLGLPVQYATYPFQWEDQKLDYPPELRALSRALPFVYHLACKVQIEGRWVLVDATWDIALKSAGFPVNVAWDGASDTLNAASATEEVLHSSLKERMDYVKSRKELWSSKDKESYAQFSDKFNLWLAGLRRAP